MSECPYTYAFIRKDLPIHAQIVQASHAALEMGLKIEGERKPKQTSFLIMLEAKDERQLLDIAGFLDEQNIDHHMFFEPDQPIASNTSICTEPIYGDQRKLFKKFKLWKQ